MKISHIDLGEHPIFLAPMEDDGKHNAVSYFSKIAVYGLSCFALFHR